MPGGILVPRSRIKPRPLQWERGLVARGFLVTDALESSSTVYLLKVSQEQTISSLSYQYFSWGTCEQRVFPEIFLRKEKRIRAVSGNLGSLSASLENI